MSGLCELIKESFIPDTLQRYVYHNLKFSSEFKLYDPSIPSCLQNRPHWFIKHCMQRLHAAQSSGMNVGEQDDVFFVVRSGAAQYHIQLGDDNHFFSCSCADFQRFFMPCKHIFAVLTLVPGYSWMSLPAYFRNSPLISIDDDVISVEQRSGRLPDTSGVNENEELQGMELHEISSEADDLSVVGEWSDAPASPPSHSDLEDSNLTTSRCLEGTVIGDELGEEKEAEVPSKESLHVATALRSNLQVLQDFTYLCKDPSSLKAIANSIERVVSDAKSLLPREGGLVLRPTPQKRKLSACGPLSQKVAGIRSLPSRTRKKTLSLFDRYKRRAGRYEDMVKAAAHVPVTVEEPSQASHGSKPETTDEPKLKRPHTLSPKPSKTTQRQLQKGKTKAKPDRKPKVAAAESVSDEVQLCGQYMQSTVYPYKKRLMTDSDFLIILSSDSRRNWLNDTIINCAQNILRQQFHPPGLYDTSLGPHLTYPRAQFFYQILHDDNHWILVSTVDCQPYSVKVYDSLFRGQLSPNIFKSKQQPSFVVKLQKLHFLFRVCSSSQM